MAALGIFLFVIAVAVFAFALYSPPVARVPQERRLAPGAVPRTPLEEFVDRFESLVDAIMRRRGWNPFPAEDLELAGIRTPQSAIVTSIIAGSLAAMLAGYGLGGVLLGLICAVVVPIGARMFITQRRAKRRQAFAEQLESTLEVIRSALRAGHSLPSALDTVAVDAPSPTDEEFARIVNESRLGRDIVEAMQNTARRMDSQDIAWVADAVAVQRDTGGNLAEVLERVASTIRERAELHQKVRALSAEGRSSAWVMLAVPPALGAYLTAMNPEMFKNAFLTVTGFLLIGICTVLYFVGVVWIRKIVTVEV